MEMGVMGSARKQSSTGSTTSVFVVGVVIGGIGGGLAGWLLGGHVAPLLTSILNLVGRDGKRPSVRFEALQQ